MLIPLWPLLFLYGLFLVIYAFFTFFTVYHYVRYGFWSSAAFFMTALYAGGSVVLLFASYQALSAIDWSAHVQILSGFGTLPVPLNTGGKPLVPLL